MKEIFLDHLRLVEFTGWGAHWLTQKNWLDFPDFFVIPHRERELIAMIGTFNIPGWSGINDSDVKRPLWGQVIHRIDDDGEILFARRSYADWDVPDGPTCIMVFASSVSFWLKIVLEIR